jgi:hypothetical protein
MQYLTAALNRRRTVNTFLYTELPFAARLEVLDGFRDAGGEFPVGVDIPEFFDAFGPVFDEAGTLAD